MQVEIKNECEVKVNYTFQEVPEGSMFEYVELNDVRGTYVKLSTHSMLKDKGYALCIHSSSREGAPFITQFTGPHLTNCTCRNIRKVGKVVFEVKEKKNESNG